MAFETAFCRECLVEMHQRKSGSGNVGCKRSHLCGLISFAPGCRGGTQLEPEQAGFWIALKGLGPRAELLSICDPSPDTILQPRASCFFLLHFLKLSSLFLSLTLLVFPAFLLLLFNFWITFPGLSSLSCFMCVQSIPLCPELHMLRLLNGLLYHNCIYRE